MRVRTIASALIFAFIATSITASRYGARASRAFAQSGKNSENTNFANGDFFIVSSIDLARKQILLKRPTEVTELMRLEDATRCFEENGKPMRLADIRAGDTVYITSRSNQGKLVAVAIRKGAMTLDVLRERYLGKTK
jgi:hypothetical protein